MRPTLGPSETTLNGLRFRSALGQLLLSQLPGGRSEASYIPFNDIAAISVEPTATPFWWSSLVAADSGDCWGSTAYYSLQTDLTVDGSEKIVPFSDHAAQRICERTVKDWQTLRRVR